MCCLAPHFGVLTRCPRRNPLLPLQAQQIYLGFACDCRGLSWDKTNLLEVLNRADLSNAEAAEGSRLPWGTNQLWSQFYIICTRAWENETCSCCCLHQGRVTAVREKKQIPLLVSCGMKEMWFYSILLCLCCICPLFFCVKCALALNPVHHCPLLGQQSSNLIVLLRIIHLFWI